MASIEQVGNQQNLASLVEGIRKQLYLAREKSREVLNTLEGPRPEDSGCDKSEPHTYREWLYEMNRLATDIGENLEYISGSLGCNMKPPRPAYPEEPIGKLRPAY